MTTKIDGIFFKIWIVIAVTAILIGIIFCILGILDILRFNANELKEFKAYEKSFNQNLHDWNVSAINGFSILGGSIDEFEYFQIRYSFINGYSLIMGEPNSYASWNCLIKPCRFYADNCDNRTLRILLLFCQYR
jgi:hypothetical protein